VEHRVHWFVWFGFACVGLLGLVRVSCVSPDNIEKCLFYTGRRIFQSLRYFILRGVVMIESGRGKKTSFAQLLPVSVRTSTSWPQTFVFLTDNEARTYLASDILSWFSGTAYTL
jgi:hypothetical protein